MQAQAVADRAARSDTAEVLGRIGLTARGVLWILVGFIIGRIAVGSSDDSADKQGALESLIEEPGGRVMVALVAVGFFGYATWRLIEAVRTNSDDSVPKRLANGGRAAVNYFLFAASLPLVFSGEDGSSSSGNSERSWTQRVLEWPGGRWLVGAVGVAIIAVGLYNGYRAVSRNFRKKLDEAEMSPRQRTWFSRAAVIGLAARGVVFSLVGWFLVRAAVQFDTSEPIGLDESVRALRDEPWGPAVLLLTAVGLCLYGLFSFVEARYRRILE